MALGTGMSAPRDPSRRSSGRCALERTARPAASSLGASHRAHLSDGGSEGQHALAEDRHKSGRLVGPIDEIALARDRRMRRHRLDREIAKGEGRPQSKMVTQGLTSYSRGPEACASVEVVEEALEPRGTAHAVGPRLEEVGDERRRVVADP